MVNARTPGVEVLWDGRTVWVNDATGCCIGRLSRFGVDVHRSGPEQVEDGQQCLDCVHLPPVLAWPRFILSMAQHHGVLVPEEARPRAIKPCP